MIFSRHWIYCKVVGYMSFRACRLFVLRSVAPYYSCLSGASINRQENTNLVKDKRNRYKSNSKEAEQGACPADTELIIHGRCKKWEPSPETASHKIISSLVKRQ